MIGRAGVSALTATLACACGRLGFDAPATADGLASEAAGDTAISLGDFDIVITVDIAYQLFVGTAQTVDLGLGGVRNSSMANLNNCPVGVGPERWTFLRSTVPAASYIYVAAWDDGLVGRGFVATIRSTSGASISIVTGDPGWEVCANGSVPSGNNVVTPAMAATTLAACNAGTSASLGWIGAAGPITAGAEGSLVKGPGAAMGGAIGPVCTEPGAIATEAFWVWYHPTNPAQAFNAGNNDRGYLLFRHAI